MSHTILPSLATALCIGLATVGGAVIVTGDEARATEPDVAPTDTGQWSVRQHEGGDSVELVTRDEAGAFGAICSQGSCVLFIEPIKGCDPGSVYPVMANSASVVAMVESACQRVTESREPGGTIRTLATIAPSEALMMSIASGERIALAFPQTEGDVDVVSVETEGLREALRTAGELTPAALESKASQRRASKPRPRPAAVY